MTTFTTWETTSDQEASITMTFDVTADGSPEDGWSITGAILTELAVWLNDDQAEEPQVLCVDRTAWLTKFLTNHAGDRRALEAALADQWESDHEFDAEQARPSWREAVMACVD